MAFQGELALGRRNLSYSFAAPDLAADHEVTASVRMEDDSEVHRPLARLRAEQVLAAGPWRTMRNRRGQRHYSGFYWAATAGCFVIYESRLELARLLLADFDPDVVGIAAQPFRLQACVNGRIRRHVPDFLLAHADHSVRVVNVKPASRLADPKVAEALAWPTALIESHGWDHEVWTGQDPVYLSNVRFLASVRRPGLIADELVSAVHAAFVPGDTIGVLTDRLAASHRSEDVKPAVLRLLWLHQVTADLHRTLDHDSVLEVAS